MASRKQTRKQQIAEDTADDPFLEKANELAAWTEKNLRSLTMGALGIVVVVAGVLFAKSSQVRGASEVTSKLTEAVDGYREATDPQAVATSTVPEKLKVEFSKALPAFEKLAGEEGGSGAGNLSRLYAGDLHRRLGDHDKAESMFKAYLDNATDDDIMRFFALEGAGYAAEEQGKNDAALAYFDQLTKLPSGYYKDYGLKHMGRIHELKGENDKALAAYKRIVDELPDSKLRDFADARINALQ